MNIKRSASGFTLVEIAVVLVIVGLLTAGVVAVLNTFLKTTRSKVTNDNASVIQQNLQRFIERYGRLPCPAVPTAGTGVEDATPLCGGVVGVPVLMARGVIPWVTLGIPLEQAQDGYGRMYTYNVTIAATQTTAANVSAMRGTMTIHSGLPVVMGLPTAGGNQINSCWSTGGAPPANENSCNLNAVVVLLSHGENGWGGYTSTGGQLPAPTDPLETENVDANVAFIKGNPVASGYDDQVFAWAPDDLVEPLTRQGAIKSAAAVTTDTLRNSAAAVSNFMVNNVAPPSTYVVPLASPVALPPDAWGNPLAYSTTVSGNQLCGLAAGTVVFTVKSLGVDGIAGTNPNTNRNDDLSIPVGVDLLRSQVNNRPGNAC
jgi:prepilin-type N-terminal cleavage/methylation domain-containing protein